MNQPLKPALFTSRSQRFSLARRSLIVSAATVAMAVASSVPAQSSSADNIQSAAQDKPLSLQESVQVMVEMNDVPAGVPFAQALTAARSDADAKRKDALAHPNAPGSQALLKSQKPVVISSADADKIKGHVQHLDQAQQALLPALTGPNIGAQVIFRTQRAYNGIAVKVSPAKISEISQLPGVKAVHPMHPKYQTAFTDIDFLGARSFWTKADYLGGVHGEDVKVAIIDSGLDYIHTDFGGPGSPAAYAAVTDTNAAGYFPNAKVAGGHDFAGDSYSAGVQDTPHPDDNPMDSSNGHGTACASLIGGYGVNFGGTTYVGPYDNSTNIAAMKISPGFAPRAKLYPLRVFGVSGSTNLVTQAIDWAMDPNGDGDLSDHMDVISMSLGSNEGYTDDDSAVAAAQAAAAGIVVCSAAGNGGDTYYMHSSPAAASGTLSVAASFNDQGGFIYNAGVTGNSANLSNTKFFAVYSNTSPRTPVTGDVVYAVPANGSTALTNAAQVAGKIVLIDRGVVTFSVKAQNAMAAGAKGIIIANTSGDPIVQDTSTASPALNIPDVMISTANGAALKAAAQFNSTTGVPANPTNVTIAPDNGTVVRASTAADTMPAYSARGPRLGDSALKPDITAPAEVVGVAVSLTGNSVGNFNGTSSATPHVAGSMALMKQLHPDWSVQELNALACATATHDLFTTSGHTTKYGVGRVGAGRIDLTNASNAKVVAYNGDETDQIGVSFGVVETPVNGSSNLTKHITVVNNGTSAVTYNLSIQNNPALAGTSFALPNGTSLTVAAGTSLTIPITFTATGSALKHVKEASVPSQLPAGFNRHWMTEAGGYAVFTPTDGGSPTLRVAVYAAPKPVSAMHTSATGFAVKKGSNGTVSLPLAGAPVNTGTSFPTDIISLVKALELQYVGQRPSTDANVLKYVGVTSDYSSNGNKAGNTVMTFGIEGFGDAALPEFNSSDKEIYIDTNHDGTFDFVIFLSSVANGSAHSNAYFPFLADLKTGAVTRIPIPTNLIDPVQVGTTAGTGRDTNSFNHSAVLVSVPLNMLLPATAQGNGAPTKLQYFVTTFDRNGAQVDGTPLLSYDVTNPGFGLEGGRLEPFYYDDLPTTSIPVNYNAKNFNGSRGVWLVHRHNGDGLRSDVVPFTIQ